MARLRVTDIDAVEQQDNLFGGAASDRDVSLGSDGASLAYVYANGVFQQIVNTLYGGLRNIAAIQYSYHSRSLTLGQWRSRSRNTHLFQHHFAGGSGRCRVRNHRFRTHTLGRCVCKCRYRQHATYHLSAQAAEERVPLVSEVTEHQGGAPQTEFWFVHC